MGQYCPLPETGLELDAKEQGCDKHRSNLTVKSHRWQRQNQAQQLRMSAVSRKLSGTLPLASKLWIFAKRSPNDIRGGK